MKSLLTSILLFSLIMLSTSLQAQKRVTAGKGVPVKISGGFSFTEGPTCDGNGNIYFTDQPNNRIMKYTAGGEMTVFLEPAGRSNGLYFGSDGYIYACADENTEIWKISESGEVSVFLNSGKGERFNGPNDLWTDSKGGIYFTDPFYARPWWNYKDRPRKIQGVYYLPRGSSEPITVDAELEKPNGITGSSDGKRLYVADIGAGKTYRYDINADGSLSGKTLFCNQGSDGMTADTDENIYLTGDGVTVYSSKGKKIGHIAVPERWTANVCFGGKGKRMLFITATESLYSVKMKTTGVPGPGK